jgi:hypothetical protein
MISHGFDENIRAGFDQIKDAESLIHSYKFISHPIFDKQGKLMATF